MGLKNLLHKPHIFCQGDGEYPAIRLIKESTLSRYGEDRERVIGIEIDGLKFVSKGLYKIFRKHQ